MSEIIRAVSEDGLIKIMAISARDIVEKARVIHNLSPVASAALGRTLSAASLLGNMMKEERGSVTVRINGGGPLGTVMAVSDSSGNPRGYVQNPFVDLPCRTDGKLDVGTAVGSNGTLTVSRDLGLREPYIGQSALVSGEIAEDFARYFAESEQILTACAFGVLVSGNRSILAAGGYIAQLMPGADEELVNTLEENVKNTGQVTTKLSAGDAESLVHSVLRDLSPVVLGRQQVYYKCPCSRQRVMEALMCLGNEELNEIALGNDNTVADCQFCGTAYSFEAEEIGALIKGMSVNDALERRIIEK